MGRPKALLKWKGKTFLENICENLENADVENIVIVTNKSIDKECRLMKLFQDWQGGSSQPSHLRTFAPSHPHFKRGFVINPNPENGMLSSFRCGLRTLDSLNTNVMLCLTDHPAVKTETYKILIENAKKNKIIIPKYNDRRGHPVIFGADFISELLEKECPEGARSVVRAHPESVKEIIVDDSGIILDIDTPEDAENAGINI
ncbi:nucleotidyltransferase family protein [bacterium]|nr:nucleotidyltransferase family protein [bacterium]